MSVFGRRRVNGFPTNVVQAFANGILDRREFVNIGAGIRETRVLLTVNAPETDHLGVFTTALINEFKSDPEQPVIGYTETIIT